jgi:transglutaminase-like putative cysteine protease
MKTRLWFQATLTLALLASSIQLFGQFQPPTEEELKMTAEPKAPGVAAIYLYREETADDTLHFHSLYVRIKVLTEKGKELATVNVPYSKGTFSVTDVKARTIHSDGTIIPLDIKPTDLVEQKGAGYQINNMVFTLPSVEVGSILEYRLQLRYPDESVSSPDWDVQQRYFVRKAHYSFLPSKHIEYITDNKGNAQGKLLYSSMLPPPAKVVYEETTGRYTLDIQDVAPQPEEEFMPPLQSMMAQVKFYYTAYYTKEDYWQHEGSRWSKEMDHFASETKPLKDAVATLITPADSEEVKARKLYDAVMALENTDYTRSKSSGELKQLHIKQTRDAEDVWTQKSGSSDEIALLYLAMARIAGLKAYAMTVCNRDRRVFSPYFMSIGQFDDVLVLVNIGGKEVPLDPGKKFAPFGELAWKHTLVSSLRQGDKTAAFSGTPGIAYKEASTLRVADITLARDGSITGVVRVSMNGPEAIRWRELAVENDEDEVKKQFNEEMRQIVPDGVRADFDHFLGLEDYHSQLMGIVKISGNMGTATGKRVFLPGVFFESRARHPFVAQETRMTAVDMRFPEMIQDDVTYHLPDTFTVESSPTETKLPWAGHALLQIKSTANKNDIEVVRAFIRGFALLEPKDYPALRDFYQKVTTADQQQLVLTAAAPAAQGN